MARGYELTFRGAPIAVEKQPQPDQPPLAGQSGAPTISHQKFMQMGVAITPRCVAFGRTDVNVDFPDDGAGLAQEGDANRIRLAADVPIDVEYVDLLVVPLLRPWDWRVIAAFNSGTLDATPNVPWATPITPGTPYTLLVDLFTRNQVTLKPEYEDDTTVIEVAAALFTVPLVAGDVLHRLEDNGRQRIDQRGHGRGVTTPGRFHGQMLAMTTRGELGLKWTVTQYLEGSGAYDLYSGGA